MARPRSCKQELTASSSSRINERPKLFEAQKLRPLAAMAVSTSIRAQASANPHPSYSYALTCKPSLLYLRQLYRSPSRPSSCKATSNFNGGLSVRAYTDDSNTISGFAKKVIGSLPVVGLVARILSEEGGLGGDIIDFAEFRRRVGKKCSITDSGAFYEFRDRRGRSGDPLYVLLCCWLAAVGAGLLKSEEILEGVARLRISNDIEFEEENFLSMMNEAKEKRAKLKAPPPTVPMNVRAEKALEAIYVCCFGGDAMEEKDERLLGIMLNAVFPSVGQSEINRIVKNKARKIAEGGDEEKVPEPKTLSKEAIEKQMKDLQFLKGGSTNGND